MSTVDEISNLIEHLYALDRILNAMEKRPVVYEGIALHSNESHTLKQIAMDEGLSQADLSQRMYRTKGATSVAVDKLVEKGLIRREREEGNQRRYLLTLTDLGRRVNEAHLRYDEAHVHWVAPRLGLSEEELQAANRTLEQVVRIYANHYLEAGKATGPRE